MLESEALKTYCPVPNNDGDGELGRVRCVGAKCQVWNGATIYPDHQEGCPASDGPARIRRPKLIVGTMYWDNFEYESRECICPEGHLDAVSVGQCGLKND